MNIEITPETPHRALIERALKLALGETTGEVSVHLLTAVSMRALNRDSLNHDYSTDVLAFDHGGTPEGRLLEIVVCPSVARREAKNRGIPLEQELLRYVVHGALHLKGHDDHEESTRKLMWRAQEKTLRKLFGKKYVPARDRDTRFPLLKSSTDNRRRRRR